MIDEINVEKYINNEFIYILINEGIIFENDLGLTSTILEKANIIEEIVRDKGYNMSVSCTCEIVQNVGYMYAIYDLKKYGNNEVKRMIKRHFESN